MKTRAPLNDPSQPCANATWATANRSMTLKSFAATKPISKHAS